MSIKSKLKRLVKGDKKNENAKRMEAARSELQEVLAKHNVQLQGKLVYGTSHIGIEINLIEKPQ